MHPDVRHHPQPLTSLALLRFPHQLAVDGIDLLLFGQHVRQKGPHPLSPAVVGILEDLWQPRREAVLALRDRDAALPHEAACLVHQLRGVAHQPRAVAVQRLPRQLRLAFDRHDAHARVQAGSRASLGSFGVVIVGLDVLGGGHQPHVVPLGEQLESQVTVAQQASTPIWYGSIFRVISAKLPFEYRQRVSTCPLASRPTKWTDVLVRSTPILATPLSTLVRDGCRADAMLVLLSNRTRRPLEAAGSNIVELADTAERERTIP